MRSQVCIASAAFKLLLRKLPEDKQAAILATYKDLVEEERQEVKKAVEQKLAEATGTADPAQETKAVTDEQVEQEILRVQALPPQRVEVVDTAFHQAIEETE